MNFILHLINRFSIQKVSLIKTSFVTSVVITELRVLTVYLMLEKRQKVNFETIEQIYGCSQRTFKRLIASVRDAVEIVYDSSKTYVIYNKKRNSYELIMLNQ